MAIPDRLAPLDPNSGSELPYSAVSSELDTTLQSVLVSSLIGSSLDGIFAIDRAFKVIAWNAAVARMSGLSAARALDRDVFSLHPVLLRNGEAERLKDALGGRIVAARDQRYRLPGRETTYFWTHYSPLRDRVGDILGVIGIVRDVTSQHRLERALRHASERADSANRAKSQFLANMSHEIRTPMHAVLSASSLLSATELHGEQRDCVTLIQEGATNLLTVIDSILDFSKIESGEISLELQPFDFRACLDSALKLVAHAALSKELEVVRHIGPAVPQLLIGDVTKYRRILTNLLANAIKFTSEGRVTVSATVNSAGRLEVAVTDTGIGIPPSLHQTLFQPFHQLDASTTRKFGGTGLGLAICKGLIERMDGTIKFESEIGKGSTFTFNVPILSA